MTAPDRRRFLLGSAAVGAGITGALAFSTTDAAAAAPGSGPVEVLVNNIGYELIGQKRAVIGDVRPGERHRRFHVVDATTGAVASDGNAQFAGTVDDWRQDHFPDLPLYFWVADFSGLTQPGSYFV